MAYNTPVLLEVGQAADLVLGILPLDTENFQTFNSKVDGVALGLDE